VLDGGAHLVMRLVRGETLCLQGQVLVGRSCTAGLKPIAESVPHLREPVIGERTWRRLQRDRRGGRPLALVQAAGQRCLRRTWENASDPGGQSVVCV
jgi:hypothetical protein